MIPGKGLQRIKKLEKELERVRLKLEGKKLEKKQESVAQDLLHLVKVVVSLNLHLVNLKEPRATFV